MGDHLLRVPACLLIGQVHKKHDCNFIVEIMTSFSSDMDFHLTTTRYCFSNSSKLPEAVSMILKLRPIGGLSACLWLTSCVFYSS